MSFLKRFWNNLTGTEEVKVRARTKKGKFVADDKSTPNIKQKSALNFFTSFAIKSEFSSFELINIEL